METIGNAAAEHEAGRLSKAENLYRTRLSQAPFDVHALIGLGDVLTDAGELVEAEELYRRAIAADGESTALAGAYDGLAAVLQDTGNLDEAIIASKKAAALRGSAEDSFGVGNTLELLRRIPDALEMFELASVQRHGFFEAHFKAAQLLMKLNKFSEAASHYQAAIQIKPDDAASHCNLANARRLSGSLNDALNSARQAVEINPQLAEAHYVLGTIWKDRSRWADALAAYGRALEINPQLTDAMTGTAIVLESIGRPNDATPYFEKAVLQQPDHQQEHLNLAANLLRCGYFIRGWQELEWRRIDPQSSASRPFPQPMWDGRELSGETILIHAEQKLSEVIQFLRYVPMVRDRGGRVVLECPAAIADLARWVDGVAELVIQGNALPPFTVHCPLISLAKVLGTTEQTVPRRQPYLTADPVKVAEWAKKLPDRSAGQRVGLVWTNGDGINLQHERTRSIDALTALGAVSGILLINLCDHGNTQLPSGLKVIDLPDKISDLNAAAALISNLDVVIAVDSPLAHLAGALGKKTCLLLPERCEWCWMGDRDDSPWYPSVTLFRQSASRSWAKVIQAIIQTL